MAAAYPTQPYPNQPYPNQGYPNQGYPNQGYPNQPQQTVVMVAQPTRIMFGKYPEQIQCPNCHSTVVTRTVHENGLLTWLLCGAICFFGFWLGCQFIPFCIDDCKDVKHYCPNCNSFIGEKKAL